MGLKIQIADAEINKAKAVKELEQVQIDFSKFRKNWEEYGRDATIDIKSGTVTLHQKKKKIMAKISNTSAYPISLI